MIAAIIVLYYPDLARLERLLESLTNEVEEVIVIDNTPNPAMDVATVVDRPDSHVLYIPLGKNAGIAAAQNAGIIRAASNGHSHILLLDQDSVLLPRTVGKLLAAERELHGSGRQIAAISPLVIDRRTGDRPAAVRYHTFIASEFRPDKSCEQLEQNHNFHVHNNRIKGVDSLRKSTLKSRSLGYTYCGFAIIPTENLISSGSLIRIDTLKSIGLMREDLFIEYVDTEWALRALSAGYHSYCVPDARMIHSFGDSSVKLFGKNFYLYSNDRYYYKLRNEVYLSRLRTMGWQWRAYALSRIPYHFILYSALSKSRLRASCLLLKAIWDGITGRLGPLPQAQA
jgi:rhamnosyltransferase